MQSPQNGKPHPPLFEQVFRILFYKFFLECDEMKIVFDHFMEKHAFRWSLLYPLSFVFGVVLYLTLTFEPSVWICFFVCLTMISIVWWRISQGNFQLPILLVCLSLLVVGMCFVKMRVLLVSKPVLQHNLGPVILEGKLIQIEGGENGNRLRIELGAVSGLTKSDTPRYVRVTQKKNTSLSPGRLLECWAFLSPPPKPIIAQDYDFSQQAFFQQLGAVGFVLGECKPISIANVQHSNTFDRLKEKIAASRHSIAKYIYRVVGAKSGGMAGAMITGERSLLSTSDQELLRSVGLAHLLAISGLHMGLAAGVFFFLIRFSIPYFECIALRVPAQKVAAFGAIIGATTYLVMSGASVATQRAYIMVLISLIAILLDRPAFSMRSVIVALFVVTAIQPESVITPGFQMSFAATAAIIAVYENWPHSRSGYGWSKISNWVSSLFATSVTASLATAPFAAYHFERIAPLSIPANLLVMPIISLFSAPVASLALLAWPLGLQDPFLKAFGASLALVLEISAYVGQMSSGGTISTISPFVFCLMIVGLCLAIGLSSWYKLLAVVPITASFISIYFQGLPIAHVDRQGVLYLSQADHWIRILPENISKKPLAPLSLKDGLVDERYQNVEGQPMVLSSAYHATVSSSSCSERKETLDEILDLKYLKITTETTEHCFPFGNHVDILGFSIRENNGVFTFEKWPETNKKKRPWS